jgi:CheY-like chemotaxis protein
LGLVIAQKLVNLMGGTIEVVSEPDQGSSFSFTLQLPITQLNTPSCTARLPRIEGLAILVAEDNLVNQTIVQAMLRQLGHDVTLAGNGRQALEALAREDFDLVLMDCNMPELDGLEATRRLRAGENGVRDVAVPVIALTANAMEGDREQCLTAGMPKPVSIAALRAAIDRVRAPEHERLRAVG